MKEIAQEIVWVVASTLVQDLAMKNAVVHVRATVVKIAQAIVAVDAVRVVMVVAKPIVQFIAVSLAGNIVKVIVKLDVQPHVMLDKVITFFI